LHLGRISGECYVIDEGEKMTPEEYILLASGSIGNTLEYNIKYWLNRGYDYKMYHGLHVIDNIIVSGCKPCEERASNEVMARLTGKN
jgi:hypothetical protein